MYRKALFVLLILGFAVWPVGAKANPTVKAKIPRQQMARKSSKKVTESEKLLTVAKRAVLAKLKAAGRNRRSGKLSVVMGRSINSGKRVEFSRLDQTIGSTAEQRSRGIQSFHGWTRVHTEFGLPLTIEWICTFRVDTHGRARLSKTQLLDQQGIG